MIDVEEQVENETIVTTTKPSPTKSTSKPRSKRQPQYTVIVLNDDLHTFDYVIEALMRICGHNSMQALALAATIDSTGRAAVWSGSMEVAELKRDQIQGFGPDFYSHKPVRFPLGCYIEPLA
jgi:ATP-dependent Clp protease adaptor protein ClpS